MSKLHEYVKEIYKLADENPFEVYEKYFAEDAVTVDMDGSETKGVKGHKEAMEKWLSGFVKANKSEVISYVVSGDENDGTVISIWDYDFEHKEWGHMQYKQASVTKWKDGKVIHEQFFGDMGE